MTGIGEEGPVVRTERLRGCEGMRGVGLDGKMEMEMGWLRGAVADMTPHG